MTHTIRLNKYGAYLLLYCGFDNKYHHLSCPTNIGNTFSTKLRGHCSNDLFCFFSASEALFKNNFILLFLINAFIKVKLTEIIYKNFRKVKMIFLLKFLLQFITIMHEYNANIQLEVMKGME